jgi:hypothetical protein
MTGRPADCVPFPGQMGKALPTISKAEDEELKSRLKALREMDE